MVQLAQPTRIHSADVHMAYAHARLVKASDQPIQHDTEAIAEWEKQYPAPEPVHTRRLW